MVPQDAGGPSAIKKKTKKKLASIFYKQHMPGSERALFLVINNVLFLEICSCFVTFLRSQEKKNNKKKQSKRKPKLLCSLLRLIGNPSHFLFERKKKTKRKKSLCRVSDCITSTTSLPLQNDVHTDKLLFLQLLRTSVSSSSSHCWVVFFHSEL